MEIETVYETDDYLVLNKPVGVVVNRAESIKTETIQDWVETQSWYQSSLATDMDSVYVSRSGVCHRLDKETSGCLLVAKNPKTLYYFLSMFEHRKIKKEYVALVHGRVEPREGEVVLPLKRSLFDREKWMVNYDGKKAISSWQVEKYFKYETDNELWKNSLTLLKIGLKTGRTHQIRVHFSFLGWPLFADEKYLSDKWSKIDRNELSHHFLHARYLAFADPKTNSLVELDSKLPDDCQDLLNKLV